MQKLDEFQIGTAALCAMIPLPPATLATLRDRDGLFFNKSDARRGVPNCWTLGDAMRLAMAFKLKETGIPSRDACIVASAAEVLLAFMAGQAIRFGFLGGRLSNTFDPERDPMLLVPFEAEGNALVTQFLTVMTQAAGGAAAQAAINEFDARLRALRSGATE
ncbi:hypothetical protein PUH89_16815 [Rhodobacter capsulatus]|uniref:Uncharacterized protein n=1 Tax=Rhodobacter capsulatus TaxID=1061 RepID=A0A1G7C3D9_RHOCA|nr:hypothetical protein [Rhodobacter capsulatus]WER08945.1 hypothetical protein PUH89_16815 [Rhodobacter capsulatus]SDE33828.1 hypothetical protein SAMN04244550_00149 [Rhodobacter capsulatus]